MEKKNRILKSLEHLENKCKSKRSTRYLYFYKCNNFSRDSGLGDNRYNLYLYSTSKLCILRRKKIVFIYALFKSILYYILNHCKIKAKSFYVSPILTAKK